MTGRSHIINQDNIRFYLKASRVTRKGAIQT